MSRSTRLDSLKNNRFSSPLNLHPQVKLLYHPKAGVSNITFSDFFCIGQLSSVFSSPFYQPSSIFLYLFAISHPKPSLDLFYSRIARPGCDLTVSAPDTTLVLASQPPLVFLLVLFNCEEFRRWLSSS